MNWLETNPDPQLEAIRKKRLRAGEFGLLLFWAVGMIVAAGNTYRLGHLLDTDRSFWVGLLTLAVWTAAPIVIRPLTTPGVTLQQRYAVVALILGAGLAWLVWLRGTLNDYSPSGLGIMATVGLVAFAGFLRLGWSTSPQS